MECIRPEAVREAMRKFILATQGASETREIRGIVKLKLTLKELEEDGDKVIFLNASPFLAVLLSVEGADECETTLTRIETGEIKATTTTHILEEIMFILVFAKTNEVLQSKNILKIGKS